MTRVCVMPNLSGFAPASLCHPQHYTRRDLRSFAPHELHELQPRLCAQRRTRPKANSSRCRWSLLSCQKHEPGRGQMRQHPRGPSCVFRLYWRRCISRQASPPSHLAPPLPAVSGSFYPAQFSDDRSLHFIVDVLAATHSDNEGKPYGAPSVCSRGSKPGLRFFKGPEAWYRLELLWSGTDRSNDKPEAGVTHQ